MSAILKVTDKIGNLLWRHYNAKNRIGGLFMQNVKKAVFVLITIAILLFSYTAYFGVHTTYGDATTDYVKSVDDITWGGEGQGYTVLVLQPELDVAELATTTDTDSNLYASENVETFGDDISSEETASEEVSTEESTTESTTDSSKESNDIYEDVRVILEKRMSDLGVPDSQITYKLVSGTANGDYHLYSIQIPNKSADSTFASTIGTVLMAQGSLEVKRIPASTTTDTSSTEETDDGSTVLFTSDDVYKASLSQTSSGSYSLQIQLNNDATKKFRTISQEMVDTGDTLSVSLDGTSLVSTTLTNEVKNGIISVSTSSTTTAVQNAAILDSGELPWTLVEYDQIDLPPTITESGLQSAQLACGIAIAVFAVLIVILFRLSGITALITLLGEAALMLAFVTGYYPDGNGILLTKAGIVGAAVALTLGALTAGITAMKFQQVSSEKNGMTKNKISQAISSGRRYGFTINIILILIAVILMGIYGPATNTFSFLRVFFFWGQTSYISIIYLFAQTLLIGAILNLAMQVLIYPAMLWSLMQYNSLKKRVFWGGNRA